MGEEKHRIYKFNSEDFIGEYIHCQRRYYYLFIRCQPLPLQSYGETNEKREKEQTTSAEILGVEGGRIL
jgi:hypothetical protein